ncbi:MAG: 3-hydroxyacyl-ACP dehydratase FabZ family protein [Planctomycetota bacterium]|nr:3-hydroxyacyl-ACP dehydratase FabZ family protein [Planctomycetota bacterium]
MPPRALFDLSKVDPAQVAADIETIRESNPQRYEFEQLSHICYVDKEVGELAGVLDVPEDVWWGRGHVPERPLMPGVLMLESAAQLCSWFVHQVYDAKKYPGRMFGFGGIDDVKYRSAIFPPDRMIIVGKAKSIRPRRAIFETQGYHDDMERMVFQATITGLWI